MRIGFAALAAVAVLLAGCTSNPIPEGYTGPVAHITDSWTARSGSGVDIFYLSKVDDRRIDDSLAATTSANSGRGFQMSPVVIGRNVPARATTFTIVGRTHYAAPILELMNAVYEISGQTSFTPQPNQSYVVRGVLGDDYSAVWIAEAGSGNPVGQKVEIKGSSKLGILAK